jgi:putative ABC transport system permease protein
MSTGTSLRRSDRTATTTVVGFASVFTVLLTVVASLGVFNTVCSTSASGAKVLHNE